MTAPSSTIPTRTILLFRLIVLIVVAAGITETIELFVEPYFNVNTLIFELIEHSILVILLLLLMTRFVTAPMLKEIALRKDSERRLEESETRNASILQALPDAILVVSADGTVLEYTPKGPTHPSFEVGANVTMTLQTESVIDFLRALNATLQGGQNQRLDLMFKTETDVSYQVFNFVRLADQEVMIFVRDITGRKVYEEQLEHLSTHDVLTGLYNRTFYEAELNRLASGRKCPVSIVVADLDGLKGTNDTYGHAAGDRMICKAATILKQAFRAEDLVARTGGDEFTILLPETDKAGLAAAVKRIENRLLEANRADDGYCVKLSLGTAIAESQEKLPGAVKSADLAMYRNKAANKSL